MTVAHSQPYTPDPAKCDGCCPVLFIGPERVRVHMVGAETLHEIGTRYGIKGWAERTAVYTYDIGIGDSTIQGNHSPRMYVYLALVPVEPDCWDIAHAYANANTELE